MRPTVVVTMPAWGHRVEQERRNRILVSVYAYAYEFDDSALVSDAEYDRLARTIDTSIATGHPLDQFFKQHYSPDTGMWIRHHPCLPDIIRIYKRYFIQ